MEEIYVNVEFDNPASQIATEFTNNRGSGSSHRLQLALLLSLGLLNVFLLIGLISLGVHSKTCPAGWRMFSCSCYLNSPNSGSWDKGREDCRNRGGDLVVIDNADEQAFVSNLTGKSVWIGLNDKETEGSWKWVDGTSLNFRHWSSIQPDNGGGDPKWGEEDCAHIRNDDQRFWNDISCSTSMHWICEKVPT